MGKFTKEEFCKIIDESLDLLTKTDQINHLLKGYPLCDFFDAYSLVAGQIYTTSTMLTKMYDDINGWIDYWLFECEGIPEKFEAYDDDEHRIVVRNSADIYELIVNNKVIYEEDLYYDELALKSEDNNVVW